MPLQRELMQALPEKLFLRQMDQIAMCLWQNIVKLILYEWKCQIHIVLVKKIVLHYLIFLCSSTFLSSPAARTAPPHCPVTMAVAFKE